MKYDYGGLLHQQKGTKSGMGYPYVCDWSGVHTLLISMGLPERSPVAADAPK